MRRSRRTHALLAPALSVPVLMLGITSQPSRWAAERFVFIRAVTGHSTRCLVARQLMLSIGRCSMKSRLQPLIVVAAFVVSLWNPSAVLAQGAIFTFGAVEGGVVKQTAPGYSSTRRVPVATAQLGNKRGYPPRRQ